LLNIFSRLKELVSGVFQSISIYLRKISCQDEWYEPLSVYQSLKIFILLFKERLLSFLKAIANIKILY
jgi:hypothetical protein